MTQRVACAVDLHGVFGAVLAGPALGVFLAACAALVIAAFVYGRHCGRRRGRREVDEVLGRIDGQVWEADVTREGDSFQWRVRAYPSDLLGGSLQTSIAGVRPGHSEPWTLLPAREQETMNARAGQALSAGAPGYVQEFSVEQGGSTRWLQEHATIRSNGPNRWRIAGIITDITARRSEQERLRARDEMVVQTLARADCLLWRALVKVDGKAVKWLGFDMPTSALYRRLFGDRDLSAGSKLWSLLEVPDLPAMNARSTEAILSGSTGYEQDFRAIRGSEIFWLHEQVSILPAGSGEFQLVGVIMDVSARRAAVEARKASEAQIEQILARADCLLWQARVFRVEGEPLRWILFVPRSSLYRRLFGSDPGERPYLAWDDIVPPDQSRRMYQISSDAMLSGAGGYEQEFCASREGRTYWLREQVTIQRVGENEWYLVGAVIDVSARHEADQALRVSEERYRALFAQSPVAIIETDCSGTAAVLEGVPIEGCVTKGAAALPGQADLWAAARQALAIRDVNTAALRLFGAASAEEFRARVREVLRPETLAVLRQCLRDIGPACDVAEASASVMDFSGQLRPVQVRVWCRVKAGQPDLTRVVIGLVDLTDLRQAEADLAAEKERLTVTLAAMADAVITTDRAGSVLFANRAAGELLRLAPEAVCGRHVDEVCRFSSEVDRAPVAVPVAAVVEADVTRMLPPRTKILRQGDASSTIEGACTPVHDATGTAIGTVLVFRDVTERERLELEISRASKLQSVGVLAGGIAHDFNNLLTVIMGNVVVARQSCPEGDVAACLREAETAVMRAKDLTLQLLTFARGGDPVRSAVHLPDIIIEAAQFGVHGSAVRCEFDLARDLWLANVDRGQIGQVIQNLVINAVQAMPQGGVVRISARNESIATGSESVAGGDYVAVTVTDSGCGIASENLGKIFDPYFTTKPQGSGLGLATVYSIIKKHRGAIDVSSVPGDGTTFRLLLPALRRAVATKSSTTVVAPPRLKGRILFMDDEEPIRKVGGRMLARLGLTVETAADGAEAVRHFQAAIEAGNPFDVVMLDLTVPGGMSGLEAFEKIRTIDPAVRGIVSSGYSSDPVMGDFQAYGFVGMVPKPYRIEECAQTLGRVLALPRGETMPHDA